MVDMIENSRQWPKFGLYLVQTLTTRNRTMTDDTKLIPSDTWQTQARGDNDSEYQIYKTNAEQLGWVVKTYEEWLNS